MTEPLEVEFRKWVNDNARTGVNGFDEEKKYVSGIQLENYWSSTTLCEIISTIDPPLSVPVDTIRKKYLRIFSILVFIRKLGNIILFLQRGTNDSNLPLGTHHLLDEWHGCLDDFLDQQWQFCPWVFPRLESDKRQLPARQILPIRYKGPVMREGWSSPAARIHIVNIDDDYCQSIPREAVFKIYEGVDTRQLYNREAEVYTRLRRLDAISITNCYGSFEYTETNKRIIILEYTREGSLLDFFKKTPPDNSSDLELLWRRLLLLLDGLYLLHNPDKSDSRSLSGIHHDIQPANILVFREEGNSAYDVSFKLADFGLAEIVRIDGGEGVTVPIDNEGNRMYSAPESYSNYRIMSEVRPHLNSVADLWSLGAVYSDFLAWSIGGGERQESYRTKRKNAIAKLSHITEAGFDACFHDGDKRLPAVEDFHKGVLKDKVDGDFVSPCMSQFILEFMMVEPRVRLMAMQAKGRAINMINAAKSGPTLQRPTTPEIIHPVRNRPSSYSHERKVSVCEVYEALMNKRSSWKQFRRYRSHPSDVGMSLPGMQNARNQINRHGGRDQILVIDDYESMIEHRRNVKETARVISYSVKVSDKDGMDLYFASDSCNPQKCQNSSDVEAKIRNKVTVSGCCDMKKCLEDVMDQVKANGTKPTGIYIFTDGIWDPEHKPEVKDVIHESIDLLIKKNAKPADLMFQFIQFGRDPEGSKRLKFLDDGCKRTHRGVEYDIVDTKHCDDHVPKIIIGSISKHNDNDD
ncbi:serine/threonine protein kinase [Fusarium oxysporum f. sp. lycopersici 4287]|uniref:Serine/threonine protein kinase n=2 Tax=Fusarium oxysporum TaxID=5507 RepID=A0A0J9WCM3_FUSO4|nr:serine/threonine protein kinase [Fusarium oxysporum f. sp. lycopersici 4287]KNB20341.1 serine/threonine protein kinase [Fusarium oxysporum f. sp. lycopersici 4287]